MTQKNKLSWEIIFIYPSIIFIFTLLYLLSFRTPLLSSQQVLFYRGIVLLSVTIGICVIGIYIYFKIRKHYFESLFAAVVISAAINLTFFVVFPVSFERSITMFLLTNIEQSSINQSCRGTTEYQLEKELINKYVLNNKAIDKRLKEQEMIKTIKKKSQKKSQCIELTAAGKNFLRYAQLISSLYNLNIEENPQ